MHVSDQNRICAWEYSYMIDWQYCMLSDYQVFCKLIVRYVKRILQILFNFLRN